MWFVLGLIGALLSVAFEGIDAGFNASATGFLLGGLLGSFASMKTRVAKLEAALAEQARTAHRAAANGPPASASESAPGPGPIHAPAPAPAAAEPVDATPVSTRDDVIDEAPDGLLDAALAARAEVAARMAQGWPAEVEPATPHEATFESTRAASRPPGIDVPPRAPHASPRAAAAPRPAAPRPRIVPPPREDDPFVRFGASLKSWFTEGNLPAKIGMLVLFVGVAALVKYAVDEGMLKLSIQMRLAGVAAAALAALAFGWWKRDERRAFALTLQGGALGILLLTTFGAYRVWHLLSPTFAFGAVALIVATSAILAIRQHASGLAVLGFVGGYLAPVLISTGSNDHVALFTYYAILNAAVFGVATVRPWRALNLVGFVFTWVVGTMWGQQYYRPELFASVEPFLILFFLFYVGIAVAYALRAPGQTGAVDGTLLFGTPLIAFGLQNALVDDRDVLALSAVAIAALYGALFLWLRRRDGFALLSQAFAALALGFATLAIPLAFSAETTATAWALEGVAIMWLGIRQDRPLTRLAGTVLQALAGGAFAWFLIERSGAADAAQPMLANGAFIAGFLVALASGASAYLLDRARRDALLAVLLLASAAFWWAVVGVREILLHVHAPDEANAFVYFTAITMLVAAATMRFANWGRAGIIALLAFPLAFPLIGYTNVENEGPLQAGGLFAWLAFFAAARTTLWLLRDPPARGLGWAHVIELLALPTLLAVEILKHSLDANHGDGLRDALVVAPLLAMTALLAFVPRIGTAPLGDLFPLYRFRYFALSTAAIVLWLFITLTHEGDPAPMAFIPVLNPLELAQLASIALLAVVAARGGYGERVEWGDVRLGVIATAFLWLTMATLRAVHFETGVPWSVALLDSRVAQTALTVVWSLVGVAALLVGSKRASRPVWMGGAALMGFVLLKLLLVDRRFTGDVEGIVSFIAVGLLLTAVGWFAPSPPRDVKAPAAAAP